MSVQIVYFWYLQKVEVTRFVIFDKSSIYPIYLLSCLQGNDSSVFVTLHFTILVVANSWVLTRTLPLLLQPLW